MIQDFDVFCGLYEKIRKYTGNHLAIFGGSIAQWLAYLLLDPAAPGAIPSIPKFF